MKKLRARYDEKQAKAREQVRARSRCYTPVFARWLCPGGRRSGLVQIRNFGIASVETSSRGPGCCAL
eukprot:1145735-Pleurochrysis_carterae.AAC.1